MEFQGLALDAYEVNEPHIVAGIAGCGIAAFSGVALETAVVSARAGQLELSLGSAATGCYIGGTSAVLNSMFPNAGRAIDSANQYKDIWDLYTLLSGR